MTAGSCWADPLSKTERRVLAAKLARACRLSYAAARVVERPLAASQDVPLALRLRMFSAEASELHIDVTERAVLPFRDGAK